MILKQHSAMQRPGLLVAINLFSNNDQPNEKEDIPYSSQHTEESSGQSPDREGENVENLPPIQPDVDPLERENPDIDEMEENQSEERPEIDPLEAPVPDLDEIDQDSDPEIDREDLEEEDLDQEEDNIERDPTIQPDTDPMRPRQ